MACLFAVNDIEVVFFYCSSWNEIFRHAKRTTNQSVFYQTTTDDDSLRSGHRFAGNASVCSVASSRRVPKPLNLPAWAMKSSSSFAAGGSTATLSKGGDTEGNRDRHKQDNDNKNKHLVKKAGPGRNAVTSPYHRTYCAEENETLFEDLFEHLQRPGGGVHQYYGKLYVGGDAYDCRGSLFRWK